MKNKRIVAHFAHANGFPAGSYHQLFTHLPCNIELLALDKFAHNPHFPIDDNWQTMRDELIAYIKQHANEPVVAMGHSFGGVISYMACCKEPELFAGLIMLDPPIITGVARHVFRFAKKNALINRVTPARKAATRTHKWHKDEDLYAYFASRALFKDMDRRCIEDYINSVTHEKGGHRHLAFERNIEANIFRTIPHNLPDYYGKLKCPGALITPGFSHAAFPRFRTRFLKANPTVAHKALHYGGHMFPLEHPKKVAKVLSQTLEDWGML